MIRTTRGMGAALSCGVRRAASEREPTSEKSMKAQKQWRLSLQAVRADLVAQLQHTSEEAASSHQEPALQYDWALSTRKNYQAAAGSADHGVCSGPYADIRATLDHGFHGHYTLERQEVQDALISEVRASRLTSPSIRTRTREARHAWIGTHRSGRVPAGAAHRRTLRVAVGRLYSWGDGRGQEPYHGLVE